MIALYIHIPFCQTKCPYCDFYSIEKGNHLFVSYTEALVKEIEKLSKTYNCQAKTLYIGGGTPNLLGTCNLSKIIQSAVKSFNIPNSAEITLEVNPLKASNLDFSELKNQGLNRLSIGLQSANSNELKLLGRHHSKNDVKNTVILAKNAGINNISLDLMLGISKQNKQSILRSIEFCSSLKVAHISAYILKIEPNTVYAKIRNKLDLPCDDYTADLYLFSCKELEARGFFQYEISNFSQKGKESQHNLIYWNLGEYLGIGPSAHSFMRGERFYYPKNLNSFVNSNIKILQEEDSKIKNASKEEFLMLKFRQNKGLLADEYKLYFGENIDTKFFSIAKKLQRYGYVETDEMSFIRLTRKGFLISNSIIGEFL